jgi:phosphatidylinositol alpha-mannosyltransferase
LYGESFGIVLAEAMAAGAEITVGGNNPGYTSVLGDWPEVLFDGSSPESISELVNKFLTETLLRERIGAKQHEFVKSFDVKLIVDHLEKQFGLLND